jgi:hypothetical protein
MYDWPHWFEMFLEYAWLIGVIMIFAGLFWLQTVIQTRRGKALQAVFLLVPFVFIGEIFEGLKDPTPERNTRRPAKLILSGIGISIVLRVVGDYLLGYL